MPIPGSTETKDRLPTAMNLWAMISTKAINRAVTPMRAIVTVRSSASRRGTTERIWRHSKGPRTTRA